MKAKELMIDDWVMYHNELLHKSYPTRVEDGEHIDYIASNANFEPIPLTPEILEKNVFKKFNFPKIEGQHEWSWWANADVSLTLWCRELDDNPMNGWMVRIDSYPATICCKIESVHELQHALRLVRIKKDIVL